MAKDAHEILVRKYVEEGKREVKVRRMYRYVKERREERRR